MFFFKIWGRGGGENKKSSENDQLTGHFQSFFYSVTQTESQKKIQRYKLYLESADKSKHFRFFPEFRKITTNKKILALHSFQLTIKQRNNMSFGIFNFSFSFANMSKNILWKTKPTAIKD